MPAADFATQRNVPIDLDGQLENVEREMFDLPALLGTAGRLHRGPDTGAANQDALLAVGLAGGFKPGGDAVVAGDIDLAERGAELLGGGFAAIFIAIEDRDLHAVRAQLFDCSLAQARRAARHNSRDIRRKTHLVPPLTHTLARNGVLAATRANAMLRNVSSGRPARGPSPRQTVGRSADPLALVAAVAVAEEAPVELEASAEAVVAVASPEAVAARAESPVAEANSDRADAAGAVAAAGQAEVAAAVA
jgi:hypothetical protein